MYRPGNGVFASGAVVVVCLTAAVAAAAAAAAAESAAALAAAAVRVAAEAASTAAVTAAAAAAAAEAAAASTLASCRRHRAMTEGPRSLIGLQSASGPSGQTDGRFPSAHEDGRGHGVAWPVLGKPC